MHYNNIKKTQILYLYEFYPLIFAYDLKELILKLFSLKELIFLQELTFYYKKNSDFYLF